MKAATDNASAVFLSGGQSLPATPDKDEAHVLVEIAADALFLINADGFVTFMNPAAEEMFGWTIEELRSVRLHDAIHGKHPDGRSYPIEECPIRMAPRQGKTIADHEDTFFHKDGHPIPIYCSNAPVMRDGKNVGSALVVHDLTVRRSVESELRRRIELEESLIGIVSHDLRNPIQAILVTAGMLVRRGGLDERQASEITRILSAGTRAARLIRDLLDFTVARNEGQLPVHRRPGDAHAVVLKTVEEVQLANPARRITFHSEGSGEGAWDMDRLVQVVTNLTVNAVQYGAPDKEISVSSIGKPSALELSVHNYGPPIPPELRSELFLPLHRDRRSRDTGSIGLGLYIVHQIALAHGGDVGMESSEEKGTRFIVTLPRA